MRDIHADARRERRRVAKDKVANGEALSRVDTAVLDDAELDNWAVRRAAVIKMKLIEPLENYTADDKLGR